jgi:hypothetical protein
MHLRASVRDISWGERTAHRRALLARPVEWNCWKFIFWTGKKLTVLVVILALPPCKGLASLSICFTTMTNGYDIDRFLFVGDLIDQTIIANTNTPQILPATQFLTIVGTGILGEGLNDRENSVYNYRIKFLQLLSS